MGDTPVGTLEYKTIFVVGMMLFLSTLVLNILSQRLRARFGRCTDEQFKRWHGRAVGARARAWKEILLPAGVAYVTSPQRLQILALLLGSVSWTAVSRLGWDFLTGYPSRFPERAGVLPAVVGTIYVMLLTALFSFPVGVGAAIYRKSTPRRVGSVSLVLASGRHQHAPTWPVSLRSSTAF